MGNESSGFQDVTLGAEHRIDERTGWSVHSATKKDGGAVSVFVYKREKQSKQHVENAVKVYIYSYLLLLLHMSISSSKFVKDIVEIIACYMIFALTFHII